MRLSEAIRLGAMLKPQGSGEFVSADGRSCALGAAGDAVGIDAGLSMQPFYVEWPWIERRMVQCPKCDCSSRIGNTIVHLNDHHGWTREAIADWVAAIEPAEQPSAPARATNALDPVARVVAS